MPFAVNESSGACGLGQSLPCEKLEAACPNWANDYPCQDKYFTKYMLNRYGSWVKAQQFWEQQFNNTGSGWW